MRVTFILSTLGHPRHRKRIRSLIRLGVDVRVLAFEREGQLGDSEVPVERLGTIGHEAYANRLAVYGRALPILRRAARDSDVLYTFGTDLLGLVKAASAGLRGLQYVVEVGDIPSGLLGDSRAAQLTRTIERRFLSGRVVLVSTSPAYITGFYHRVQGLERLSTFVIENKVDPEVTPPPVERPPRAPGSPLRIGWHGLLRCEQSWTVLKRLARAGAVEVELRGVPYDRLQDLPAEAEQLPGVRYHGRFTVPDDLPAIFADVDVCWMVHHDLHRNRGTWDLARSNRLYQAGWFGTPLIGQEGKDDSNVVREHDLGLVLDISQGERAYEQLRAITDEDLARWRSNIAAAPRSLFSLTDEHERLLELLAG